MGSPAGSEQQREPGRFRRTGTLAVAVGPVALAALGVAARPSRAGHQLCLGRTGGAVELLQTALNSWFDTPLVVDGDFGPATRGRVAEFQRSQGLEPDGVVGPRTAGRLLWIDLRLPFGGCRDYTQDSAAPVC
ncbi:peptidoglycan-binding protein [Kitasatospora sp. NBC_00240]|uniref:peptidoglycan-binding domain-containing protein n=1 Tax=Kitasatospora sp. NBC_00240 TaxID=2903567 RepID=UPI002252B17E|nr:peptidoglycan-binding domain-containing protein [Kitasatospora sp. NBC_00240]MCX5213849.1 peptidoglycan-binding protein [Kitasatospora sp. NBC_00240]